MCITFLLFSENEFPAKVNKRNGFAKCHHSLVASVFMVLQNKIRMFCRSSPACVDNHPAGGVGMAGLRKKGCSGWQCIWLIDRWVVLIYKKAVATRLEARFYALGSLLLCAWKFILASG